MCSCTRSLKHSFKACAHTSGQARSQKQRPRLRVGEFSYAFNPSHLPREQRRAIVGWQAGHNHSPSGMR